ncbi:MAG: hypothetical protein MKZ80_06820 [Candidatus Nitrosopelagicus sp.]|nr:hypothetical protein [Candidatus Nitrosopelagicus sp.]
MKKTVEQFLKEYAMQSASDLVFDVPSGESGSLKIPISGPMFKRIYPKSIRSTVFHATDLKGLESLKKIEGKKNTISAFFSMMARYMEKGIATEGGLVVEMDADVLVSASSDIMSEVDKQGRRWVEMSWFANAQRYGVGPDFRKVESDLSKLIVILIKKHIPKDKKIEQTKHFGKDEGAAFDAWGKMKFHLQRHHGRDAGKILRVVIKDYFDGVEKIIRKHKDTMGKIFYGYAKSKRQTEDSWDEQLVNNIKIKKVHVLEVKSYEDDEYVVHDDVSSVGNWPIVDWGSSVELEVYTRQVVKKEIGK